MTKAAISFRAAAEECRSLAAKTPNSVEKEELHRIADQWLKLAQVAGLRDVSARITLEGGEPVSPARLPLREKGHAQQRDGGHSQREDEDFIQPFPPRSRV